jgi:hypothetical protein
MQSHTGDRDLSTTSTPRTASILQRVRQIMTVTAASFGLALQDGMDRMRTAAGRHKQVKGAKSTKAA